jgi:predicted nucleic acid-binding protein
VIVLDTNVLSALMLRVPDPRVVAWLDEVPAESVWTKSMTVFEVRFGLALLTPGRPRKQLEDSFTRALEEDLEHRILPLDQSAAETAAGLSARQRRAGRPVEIRDVLIAGIVTDRKFKPTTTGKR